MDENRKAINFDLDEKVLPQRIPSNCLESAKDNFGTFVDYAVTELKIHQDILMDLFLFSSFSLRFEIGDIGAVLGRSGIELVRDGLKENNQFDLYFYNENYHTPPCEEYWAGQILFYYQWHSNLPFKTIIEYYPLSEIIERFYPMHEVVEEKMLKNMDDRLQMNGVKLNVVYDCDYKEVPVDKKR